MNQAITLNQAARRARRADTGNDYRIITRKSDGVRVLCSRTNNSMPYDRLRDYWAYVCSEGDNYSQIVPGCEDTGAKDF